MNIPTQLASQNVTKDTFVLTSYFPLPGAGVLPVNTFLIRARQPVLIDTGLSVLREDFLHQLRTLIEPKDLRYVWLTHIDADHIGNLRAVMDASPEAQIVTTYLGMGKLALIQFPMDRIFLLNPGQSLDLGDRQLRAVRPPTFDAPETTGALDLKTRVFFSSDSFGALMNEPAESANAIPADQLENGMITWLTVDSPWIHLIDTGLFQESLNDVRRLEASRILSSHLPPAEGIEDTLLHHLSEAHSAPRFMGPDQTAFLEMMKKAS